MSDPEKIFKAYDIRGVVPDDLDADLVRAIGEAYVEVLDRPAAVVVGRDMRVASPKLAEAFAAGVTSRGCDVVDIGLASTDELYFASGHLDLPGAMFTASHNPPDYGGIKLCRAGAAPVGQETGLARLRSLVEQGRQGHQGADRDVVPAGKVERRDLLSAYAGHLRGLVDLSGIRRLTVAVDAGNGMAGLTVPAVFEGLPIDLVPMYFELDGTFPNHEANPIEPANLVDLQAKVREVGADIGLAFDGDADRCWVIDENARSVSPSAITALIAVRELAREPGAAVIHNLITSRAVPQIIHEHGGRPVRERVGHSFIKATMARTGAVFGGEHSAHFYFRDFWRADSGLLAALHTLAALGEQDQPLSKLLEEYDRYAASGEINSRVDDQAATMARVKAAYADRVGVTVDELDGLTVEHADWWFNLRPSNTEPVLRLNAEAADQATMERLRDEVLGLVRGTVNA
ncbi:phosphomannomutase/phosphoglucomutase [Actinopolymorpha singaporensis]|uniref:Phosphomannomutase n=1 Tax=Actinopolymorpha singaporensis TaxID=117157 RepID=A0A1H1SV22_9ACTN|nr:phosphomannomutase/phosphoglucomutase [Actinopolymorpha singaporensis]SDS51842.1 phosphomannomutase [Actinopolymorpha singaporensis]